MLSKTEALIRLAQIFEDSGMHSTADIIDGRMLRIALYVSNVPPKQDSLTEKYKQILDDSYRSKFKVKPSNSNFTSYRNQESYWVYPDGNVIVLDGLYHGDAIRQIEKKNSQLRNSPEYQEFQKRYSGHYHMVGTLLGAIRVFAEPSKALVVTAFTPPTPKQINAIENLSKDWRSNGFNIEQFGSVIGERATFESIPDWKIAIEKYQRAQNESNANPLISPFKDTIRKVEEENHISNEPYWKAIDRRHIEDYYPGESNAPLRKMYERSANTRLSEQLKMDFGEKLELPAEELEADGREKLMNAWVQTYPVRPLEEPVEHTEGGMYYGSQSFWVLPDGSRIELGTTWHGNALSKIIATNDLKDHEGIKKMKNKHSGDYYAMMSHYYDAIRIYAYGSDTTGAVAGSSYNLPTPEQFKAIKNILTGLGLREFEMEQTMPDGRREYFYSFEDWQHAVESQQPQKPKQFIEKQFELENRNQPLWKTIDRRNIEERYPGEANAPLRRMYQRSASTRIASNDDYYKHTLEKGHKSKFKVLEPGRPIEQFRDMHSFWLYPDGRLMDLGKQWHEEAFNDVMHETQLDAEEEFGQMYSSKDGPHEIMSDYFGMIRLFIQDKNLMVVTSYQKPTQAQIDQIQHVAQQSGRGVIKIEQYGHVPGGRLVTNSMSKWIHELSKYIPGAQGKYTYNTLRNNIDEVDDDFQTQPYWKAQEQQSMETKYPGPENEKLRKMYERSASNEC